MRTYWPIPFALLLLWLVCFHAYGQRPVSRAYQYPGLLLVPPAPAPAWAAAPAPRPASKPVATTKPKPAGIPPRNPAVQASSIQWLLDRIDYRESWGYNRGPQIDPMVRRGGGTPGQEYCGFTQAADQKDHGLPIPPRGLQGGARYWFPLTGPDAGRLVYYAGRLGSLDNIQPGDLVGIAYAPNPVIHHITRAKEAAKPLRKGRPARGFYCLAGNEGRGLNAGMHQTFFFSTGITASARWDYWR